MTDRFYCKLEEGGFAETAITTFKANHDAIIQAWYDFATKYGSEDIYCGRSMEGVSFDRDKVPLGWNSVKLPGGVYKPARVKASLEAYKEFKALGSRPGFIELANALNVGTVMNGFSLSGPAYEEHVDDQIILSLPEGSEVPEGATKIKTSEYWVLKEAAGDDNG